MTTSRGRRSRANSEDAAQEGLIFGAAEESETGEPTEETASAESSTEPSAEAMPVDSSDVAAAESVAEVETEEAPTATEDFVLAEAENTSEAETESEPESESAAEITEDPVAEDVDAEAEDFTEDTDETAEYVVPEVVLSPAPDALMAYQVGPSDVRLAWADDHGNTVWRLYRTPAFVGRSFVEVTRTSHIDRGLTRGQAYTYYVVSVDSDEVLSASSASFTYTVR